MMMDVVLVLGGWLLLLPSSTLAFSSFAVRVTNRPTSLVSLLLEKSSNNKSSSTTPSSSCSSSTSSSALLQVTPVATTSPLPRETHADSSDRSTSTGTSSTVTATNDGSTTVPNLSISLVKSIVGSGVLALPAGLADMGPNPMTVVPTALVLIAAIGSLNAYLFSLIGRICARTNTTSYTSAWEASMGKNGNDGKSRREDGNTNKVVARQFVAGTVALKTLISCLGFAMVLADAGRSIAVGAGWQTITRGQALLTITTTCLLPLSMMRDLSSLTPFSAVGVGGLGMTFLAMIWRAVDGSYLPGGTYFATVPAAMRPSFDAVNHPSLNVLKALVLACTLTTAFNAHYNAPRFHAELQDATVAKFNKVTGNAYMASALSFVGIAVAGYLTFGTACDGFILNNYSPFDPLINVSRMALVISIVMTFPLPFVGLRDGVLDLFQIPNKHRTNNLIRGTTVGLLGCITALAYAFKNLALVVAIGGGTFSTLVSAVFPVCMFVSTARRNNNANKFESKLALALMTLATGIGGTGVVLSIRKAMFGV